MEFETVFKIGSCVSVTDMSGVFSVRSCVSHNEEYMELYIQPSRNWIISRGYEFNRYKQDIYFIGPTAESNWIIRKLFAVGSYPDKPTYLKSILDEGLDTFVCLNAEYGKTSFGIYYVKYAEKLPSDCTFIHEPIEDMETVKDEIIINVALKIVELLRIGKKVYLHCAGGHGRAGTVAAVVLHILCVDLSETELFDYIQYAHDQRKENYFGNKSFVYKMDNDPMAHNFCNGQVPSTQTSEQRDQVRRIAGFL